jgi:hypothetical protein
MRHKLKYDSKEQAITDLIAKGVINEDLTYTALTHAVVWIGLIVDQQGEYNEEGNEITPPTYIDGYHVDVMTDAEIEFSLYFIEPNNAKHKFY